MKVPSLPQLALAALLVLSFLIPDGFAQSAASRTDLPPLPTGPLIRDLAPRDSWTITFERTATPETPGRSGTSRREEISESPVVESIQEPHKITITCSKPYLAVRFFDKSGENLVGYFSASRFIFLQSVAREDAVRTQFPARDPGAELPVGQEILLSARENKHFGFNWIGPDTYAGVETLDGIDCYVFQKEDLKAWIDQKQLHPVLWKSPRETRRFQHNGKPADNDIPRPVMARIEGIKKDLERFQKSPKGG